MLESRRGILYEEVVSPLEDLFQKTGWAKEISTTPAVKPRPREPSVLPPPRAQVAKQSARDKVETERRKNAERWLNQIDGISQKLREGAGTRCSSYRRIRIAVLDTGYDQDAPFFHLRSTRVKGWKDWVDPPSEECTGQ